MLRAIHATLTLNAPCEKYYQIVNSTFLFSQTKYSILCAFICLNSIRYQVRFDSGYRNTLQKKQYFKKMFNEVICFYWMNHNSPFSILNVIFCLPNLSVWQISLYITYYRKSPKFSQNQLPSFIPHHFFAHSSFKALTYCIIVSILLMCFSLLRI